MAKPPKQGNGSLLVCIFVGNFLNLTLNHYSLFFESQILYLKCLLPDMSVFLVNPRHFTICPLFVSQNIAKTKCFQGEKNTSGSLIKEFFCWCNVDLLLTFFYCFLNLPLGKALKKTPLNLWSGPPPPFRGGYYPFCG